jgi:hypothetical protein
VNQGVQGSPEALGPKTDSSGICTTICICKMQIEATLFVLQQSLRHHLHFAVGLRIRRILGESDAFSLLSSTCTTPTVLSPSDQPPSRCPSSRSDAAIAAPEGVEEGMAESPSGDIRGRRVEVDGGQAQGEEVARISPVTVLFLLAPGGVELQRSLQAARAGEPCPRGRPPIPAGDLQSPRAASLRKAAGSLAGNAAGALAGSLVCRSCAFWGRRVCAQLSRRPHRGRPGGRRLLSRVGANRRSRMREGIHTPLECSAGGGTVFFSLPAADRAFADADRPNRWSRSKWLTGNHHLPSGLVWSGEDTLCGTRFRIYSIAIFVCLYFPRVVSC